MFDLREIFECAHLKFTESGRSVQAQIHTCVRNAVTLVWGSLRLAPITSPHIVLHITTCYSTSLNILLHNPAFTIAQLCTYYCTSQHILSLHAIAHHCIYYCTSLKTIAHHCIYFSTSLHNTIAYQCIYYWHITACNSTSLHILLHITAYTIPHHCICGSLM